ncbi:hypothetical protein GDO81_024968 [Engystomops pustulosus]|uniref:Phostensin n=1 Tax=Engystomops pustulosus TaxID=76066 RepID=A0AAV6YI76_ENGPU|nr:hypothetical protein GDO81_024968 [Engystomops pustulosus]
MMEVPDWKFHLLERKRKEEEDVKRREREEEERLAKMPPWKREIILRRKAKAGASLSETKIETEGGDQEEKVGGSGEVEEGDSRVLRENIGPVQKNPFIQQEKQRRMPEHSCTKPKSTTEQMAQRLPKVDDLIRDPNLPNEVNVQNDPVDEQQSPSIDVKGRVSRLLSRFGGSRTEDDSNDHLQRVNGEGATKTVLTAPVVVEPEFQAQSIANPGPPSPSCLLTATGSQALTQETTLSPCVTPSSSSLDSEPSELSTCAAPTALSGINTRQSMTEEVRPFPFQLRPASPASSAKQLKQTTQVSPVLSRPETFKVNAGKTEEDGEIRLSPSKVSSNFQAIKRVTGESQAVQRRKGNTITVNPRKAPICENGYSVTETKSPATKPESGKKRYPTAEEIKVIGGYQALSRSCLAKRSQDKKKVRNGDLIFLNIFAFQCFSITTPNFLKLNISLILFKGNLPPQFYL